MKRRVLIAGGGTGGHLYPGLALAKRLKELYPEVELLFVGSGRRLEAEVVPREGFAFQPITIEGFLRGASIWETISSLAKLFIGTIQSLFILRRFKPEVVVGTGGFAAGPIVYLASLFHLPTLIMEQNVIPGLTIRLLAKRADKIAVAYEESSSYLSQVKGEIVLTGNPLRPEILRADRESSRKHLKISPDEKFVFITGGSRGAHTINIATLEAISLLAEQGDFLDKIRFLHHTGEDDFAYFQREIERKKLPCQVKPYIHNIAEVYAASDLIVCRAGAMTIAEITARGLPAILIPYPYASARHQEYNARLLEEKGAATIISDKDLSGGILAQRLKKLLEDEVKLKEMSQNSKALAHPSAVDKVVELVKALAKDKER